MKRIISVLAVVALMAAMLVVAAAPAFAAPNCGDGQHRAHTIADGKFNETGDPKYLAQGDKHFFKEGACYAGDPPGGI